MSRSLRVIVGGLGPIGQGVARRLLETDGIQIVGATDLSPLIAGKDLGVVLGLSRKLRVPVAADPAKLLRKTRADLGVLCTGSSVKDIKAQVLAFVQKGLHVVSTCEELSFPAPKN